MDYFTVFFILLGILFFLLFIGQKVCLQRCTKGT